MTSNLTGPRFSPTTTFWGSMLFAAVVGVLPSDPVLPSKTVQADSPSVQFDVAPVLVARPAEIAEEAATVARQSHGEDRLAVDIQISTLITSPTAPRLDQMLVEIDLLDGGVWIDDFSPRTHVASSLAGDISVERTEEATKHLGLTVSGHYGELLHGDLVGDRAEKQMELRKFQRVAPVEVVAASGTTNRGKGVFFKLRATPTQILEGDKPFGLVLRVPTTWRGGLLRVRATAQVVRRGLPGMSPETLTVGDEQFLVAVHRAGDLDAREAAMNVVLAERHLRVVAHTQQRAIRQRSTANVFHQVATALDLAAPRIASDWMQRAVFGSVDPHHDAEVRRLPVDVRVAVLDFQDAKHAFRELETNESKLVATRPASTAEISESASSEIVSRKPQSPR